MALARADLESLLRSRQLDRTLTTHCRRPIRPPPVTTPSRQPGITSLDAHLGGGFPRGQALNCRAGIVGSHQPAVASAGRRDIRGKFTAVVDVLDMFDVESAAAAA